MILDLQRIGKTKKLFGNELSLAGLTSIDAAGLPRSIVVLRVVRNRDLAPAQRRVVATEVGFIGLSSLRAGCVISVSNPPCRLDVARSRFEVFRLVNSSCRPSIRRSVPFQHSKSNP